MDELLEGGTSFERSLAGAVVNIRLLTCDAVCATGVWAELAAFVDEELRVAADAPDEVMVLLCECVLAADKPAELDVRLLDIF